MQSASETVELDESPANETMTLTARYTLLDGRARDQRTIMLAALAGIIALGNALFTALDKKEAGAGVWFQGIAAIVLGILALKCFLQARKTVAHAMSLRKEFSNSGQIPPVDVDFLLIPRPSENDKTDIDHIALNGSPADPKQD